MPSTTPATIEIPWTESAIGLKNVQLAWTSGLLRMNTQFKGTRIKTYPVAVCFRLVVLAVIALGSTIVSHAAGRVA